MKILGIIPARYASTRFEGKPLVIIDGKSMIQRVYEQAMKAPSLSKVIVATDDERIFKHVESFGGTAMMTSAAHQSGTDRCAEVVEKLNFEIHSSNLDNEFPIVEKIGIRREAAYSIVVNIQGDEPFIQPEQIEKVVEVLRSQNDYKIATLAKRIDNQQLIDNTNAVKVVFAADGRAVYFSRSPIPFVRATLPNVQFSTGEFFKHIGLYAYRASVLMEIAKLPPSRLEKLEQLEQLRWLENGYPIGVAETDLETVGIDTPEDLAQLKIKS